MLASTASRAAHIRAAGCSASGAVSRPGGLARSPVRCAAAAAAAPGAESKPAPRNPSPLSTAPPATYAVVETSGQQLFVQEGCWYAVNRLPVEVGTQIKFGRVLAVKQDGKFNVGRPYLENATVEAKVTEELRGPKVCVERWIL